MKNNKAVFGSVLFILLIVLYKIIFFIFSNGCFYGFDLTVYSHYVYLLSINKIYSSFRSLDFFGHHFQIILILFSFLYKLFHFKIPEFLLLSQLFAYALYCFAFFLLINKYFKNSKFFFIIILCFFLYPPLLNALLYEFHPQFLALPFIILCFYFISENKNIVAFISALIAVSCREEAALVIAALYLIYSFKKRNIYFFIVSSLFFIYFISVIFLIKPMFFGGASYPFTMFYSSQNLSTQNFLSVALDKPFIFFKFLFNKNFYIYIFLLILPTGFIIIRKPLFLVLSLPIILLQAITNSDSVMSINSHYHILAIPGIQLALLFSLKKFLEDNMFDKIFKGFSIFILCAFTLFSLVKNITVFDYINNLNFNKQFIRAGNKAINIVGPKSSLIVHPKIAFLFCERENLYNLGDFIPYADYVLSININELKFLSNNVFFDNYRNYLLYLSQYYSPYKKINNLIIFKNNQYKGDNKGDIP